MLLGELDVGIVRHAKMQRAGERFMFIGSREMSYLIFGLGQQSVGMIDTDFGTGVDAVLSFPEFDQPCFIQIIKVDRKSVEDHLETGRHIVIEPRVAGGLLPGVYGGGKETAAAVIDIAERSRQFLQHRTFLTFIHTFDPADDLFSAEMTEDHADKRDQKQDKKSNVHNV